MGLSGQEWVGGVPVVVPDTVGIVSAAGASWGRTEGSQWWAGSGSEGSNTMPHSQQHQAKYCKVIIAAKTQMQVSIILSTCRKKSLVGSGKIKKSFEIITFDV